ncbi:hypothetical protein [Foetidibacter luteolus]|uniref:hypothetical protein n=1 Tax=Foetidibacter luteolus TaxID=2608880 RepID=UPI001A9816AC|nr:hypothetical protein [Foetidibacter luteolus]
MGLDWRPMGKPKPGFEERHKQIFRIIKGEEKLKELSFIDKLLGKRQITKEQLIEEFVDNIIESYETIKAPRVGYDEVANEWIKTKYQESDKTLSQEDFFKEYLGYYVIELAQERDGVPVYIPFMQDKNVFRAQFLDCCKELIGEKLYNEAWVSKLAEDTLKYGQALMAITDKISVENNLQYLKEQYIPPETDEDSLESKLHILFSASKWLIFYGKNGHGFEADF